MKKLSKFVAGIVLCLLLGLCLLIMVLYQRNAHVGVATEFSDSSLLATPPPLLQTPVTLKLVTFNIQDLYVVGEDRPARMRHIGRILTELDPDIVGFQESFIADDREILIEALAGSRLQHHKYYPSGLVGSGLLMSSAWPIREAYFMRFTESGPAWRVWEGDFWGGKGVSLARIESPAGFFDIYNTHAQAGYGRPEYRILRVRQMQELAAFINESRTGASPAFVVGDMNCRIGNKDYETAVANAQLTRTMTMESGIDHIFAVQNKHYAFETLDTVRIWETITEGPRTFHLSDHAGFMSVISIIPATEGKGDQNGASALSE